MGLFDWVKDSSPAPGRADQEDIAQAQAQSLLENVEGRVEGLENRVGYLEDQVTVLKRQKKKAAEQKEVAATAMREVSDSMKIEIKEAKKDDQSS